MRHLDLATLETRLRGHVPKLVRRARGRTPPWEASTALVVADADDHLQLALIRRSERPGDRWSGHMALPGGHRDELDPDLGHTAIRESREEVGLDLPQPVARLDDHRMTARPGTVATFVFLLERPQPLVPDPREVAAARWVPLADVYDPAARTRTRANGIPFPGIAIGEDVVWGLTYGTLRRFAAAVGEPI